MTKEEAEALAKEFQRRATAAEVTSQAALNKPSLEDAVYYKAKRDTWIEAAECIEDILRAKEHA